MISNGCIRHDPELVAESIIGLICDDLKYQDKQNDPQYLMLNNKLKEDKRINKIKRQMEKDAKKDKKVHKDTHKRSSKFSSKYSDRIESIKQSNEMIKLKEQKMKKEARKNKRVKKVRNENMQEDEEVLKFRKEYEKSMRQPGKTKSKSSANIQKVAKKKTPQEIREEMLKKLEDSNLKF